VTQEVCELVTVIGYAAAGMACTMYSIIPIACMPSTAGHLQHAECMSVLYGIHQLIQVAGEHSL
jgi:hypothetical protein